MSGGLHIRPMSHGDLKRAVDWAAAEGWNPGLEDAETFYPVDPEGFLMGWLGSEPVTAISVVRHSETFGFLGFYLCQPKARGHGYGLATWKAGMAHLGARTVGLDGVPAQEANYRRSGFELAHHTQRYAGQVTGQDHADCRLATPDDLPALLALDRRIYMFDREAYLSLWLANTGTRRTVVAEIAGKITAFGTIRACREGHKIGPLFSDDADEALRLIEVLIRAAGARDIFIDVPDPNADGVALTRRLGLQPVFSCARMYRGKPPARRLESVFGEVSFELG